MCLRAVEMFHSVGASQHNRLQRVLKMEKCVPVTPPGGGVLLQQKSVAGGDENTQSS